MQPIDSITIEHTKITLHFKPPEEGEYSVQKPQSPTPFMDSAFNRLTELFQKQKPIIEDELYGQLFKV
jgi:hypothetical protein